MSEGRETLLPDEQRMYDRQQRVADEIAVVTARLDEAIALMDPTDAALVKQAVLEHPGDLTIKRSLRLMRHALTRARMKLDSIDAKKKRDVSKPGRGIDRARMIDLGRKLLWILDNWHRLGGGEKAALYLLPIVREKYDHQEFDVQPLTIDDKCCWFGLCAVSIGVPETRALRIFNDAGGAQ